MPLPGTRHVWGIVGGLGPFASAEFVRTIYASASESREQELPRIVLVSDPTCPDRSQALGDGNSDALVTWLDMMIRQLIACSADRIVVCCVTLHAVLPRLSEQLRGRVVSLVDIMLEQVVERGGRSLLLCTDGTRASRMFETHPLWRRASRHVIWPEPHEQQRVHSLIYALKRDGVALSHLDVAERLRRLYAADTIIAGCTELHLLARAGRWDDAAWIDPLTLVAREVANSGAVTCGHGLPN